nr:alcohol dehydrogenase-like 1 [Tanacetum cinerariifolium]
MQGASKIIGVDINDKKFAKGKVFGMTDFINPQNHPGKRVPELVKDMIDGQGIDYSFGCTRVSPLLNEALEGLGIALALGVGLQTDRAVSNVGLMLGQTLKGSLFGGIRACSDLPAILQKFSNKETDLDELQTHQIRLENITRS